MNHDVNHRIPHPKFMITYFLLLYLHPKKILLFLQVNFIAFHYGHYDKPLFFNFIAFQNGHYDKP